MLKAFLTEAPRLRAVIKSSLETGDAPAIALAAHSLKGSAGYFGASELQHICKEIEAGADAADLAFVARLLYTFEEAVSAAVARTAEKDETR